MKRNHFHFLIPYLAYWYCRFYQIAFTILFIRSAYKGLDRKIHMNKCILTRFDGVLEIVEPLLVFLPRDVYLDLLTGVQLRVAHAAVVLQVGGRPERSERVEMWLDAEKCIRSRCQSEGERAGDQQRHLQGRSRSAGVHSVFKPKVTLPQEICIGNQCKVFY